MICILRGVSFNFSLSIIRKFLEHFKLDLVVRGHQVVEDGYEFMANRGLVTIFSAANYCGEFDNAAAMLVVKEDMRCSFKVLRPAWHKNQVKTVHHSRVDEGQVTVSVLDDPTSEQL